MKTNFDVATQTKVKFRMIRYHVGIAVSIPFLVWLCYTFMTLDPSFLFLTMGGRTTLTFFSVLGLTTSIMLFAAFGQSVRKRFYEEETNTLTSKKDVEHDGGI